VRRSEASIPDAGSADAVRRPARQLAMAWVCVVVLAIPLSWGVAALGFIIKVESPGRDIAMLLLWSLSEEIVFRGGLQTFVAWTLARVARANPAGRVPRHDGLAISAANLLTSLAFCAVHALHKPALVVLGLFPVSLLLGASLERSGRLWVPMALHSYFNLLLYAASALASA
jgi:membrane protease YdiL (CAAX protease family)